MNFYREIVLKPNKDEFLKRFHPWVFSGAVASKPSVIEEGEVVKILSNDRRFLGVGHYQIGSIAVRVLSFEDEEINAEFYEKRLSEAYKMRKYINVIRPGNNTYRLIHGEGDNLPGLIIDIYGNTAVVQAHSVGIHNDRVKITKALQAIYSSSDLKNIFYKSEGTLPFKANIEPEDSYIFGGDNIIDVVEENDLKFKIDWAKGQKTGFFVDQRDNRLLLEKYAKGRNVLNMFCYTGGFSVYAHRGGAAEVVSVDSSSKALSIAKQNVDLNFGNDLRHKLYADDAFKFLNGIPNNKYDLIVLDPPAFAKHRGAVNNALQGYKKLNCSAFEKIKKGGVLFTFSCSQVISREKFRLAVFSAAAISGRKVQILNQLTQPADHPINIYHPEGEYLKGLVLYVE